MEMGGESWVLGVSGSVVVCMINLLVKGNLDVRWGGGEW